jgi:hypothetical protein
VPNRCTFDDTIDNEFDYGTLNSIAPFFRDGFALKKAFGKVNSAQLCIKRCAVKYTCDRAQETWDFRPNVPINSISGQLKRCRHTRELSKRLESHPNNIPTTRTKTITKKTKIDPEWRATPQ